jgi:hypothetical protein
MARGWESKAVEAQIESAQEREARAARRLTPQQAAEETKRDSLLLQRTRLLREFQNCRDPRYRQTLSSGLDYLESQLTALGWKPE